MAAEVTSTRGKEIARGVVTALLLVERTGDPWGAEARIIDDYIDEAIADKDLAGATIVALMVMVRDLLGRAPEARERVWQRYATFHWEVRG